MQIQWKLLIQNGNNLVLLNLIAVVLPSTQPTALSRYRFCTKKNQSDSAVKGVAPGIELYNYRVLGPYGSGDSSGIIAAIDKSISDGMNVINLSLGDDSNNPLDPTSIAVNNAMLSGVVTVVACWIGFAFKRSSDSSISPTTLGLQPILFGKNFTDKIEDFKGQTLPIESVGAPDEFSKKM